MKKFSLLMALMAVILLASCSKQNSAKLIPDDATYVMRFDVMQTVEKSGMKGDKSELKKWLKEMLSQSDMGKKMRDELLNIAEDPTKSGIDFTEPVYLYASLSKKGLAEFGVVGNMANRGDLTDLLNGIAKEADTDGVEKAKSGASYLELGSDGALIYTDDWFFAGMTNDVDDMIETLLNRAAGTGSLDGHKALEVMESKKGVMQFLMLYGGLSSMPEFRQVAELMPEGLDMEDLAAVADLELSRGETVITGEMVTLSKEWEKYMEKAHNMAKPISKEQVKYISDKGLSMLINLDTDNIFEFLERMAKQFEASEEDLAAVKEICEHFTGTASIDLYGISEGVPQLNAYVGTKDSQPLDMALTSLLSDESVQKIGDNEYLVATDYDYDWDNDYNMNRTPKAWGLLGFRDGQSYFSTDKETAFTAPATAYPTDRIKGRGVFARFNFQMLNDLQLDDESVLAVFKEVANTFGEAECYYTDDMKSVFRLTNTDKTKTAIEAIVDLVKKFVD